MKRTITGNVMLWLVLAAASAAAEAPVEDWQLAREADGIRVYTREVAGSGYLAFRGEAEIEAPLNALMAVLDDIEACPRWMHNCRDPLLLYRPSMLERYYYMVNAFPWPARNREMVVRSLIEQDADTRVTTVHLMAGEPGSLPERARERLPEGGGHVRAAGLQGFFELSPQGEGRTRVIYQLHLEPGGSLPAGAFNARLLDYPHHTLKNLGVLATEERYRCFNPF